MLAKVFAIGKTVFTFTTRTIQPGDPNSIIQLKTFHTRAHGDDATNHLMAWNDREEFGRPSLVSLACWLALIVAAIAAWLVEFTPDVENAAMLLLFGPTLAAAALTTKPRAFTAIVLSGAFIAVTVVVNNIYEAQQGLRRETVALLLVQLYLVSIVETHLVLSKWAMQTIEHETPYQVNDVRALASVNYEPTNMGAAISSGSFRTDGMVIIPCSMRSLGAIAHGTGDHLVHRAADVALKERRRLVLVAREMPLSDIHLENMLRLTRAGAVVLPASPGFYHRPTKIEELVDFVVGRILDHVDVQNEMPRWSDKDQT